jgi:hypothetical protein
VNPKKEVVAGHPGLELRVPLAGFPSGRQD